jgi:polyisoprenoid-binding protein YceI
MDRTCSRVSLVSRLAAGATFLALALWPVLGQAQDGTYKFQDPNNRNTVSFMLDAPLETINGLTNQIEGSVTLSGGTASGEFRVPVASIRTGNRSRDGHLASDKWLDASKNPHIVFKFNGARVPASLASGEWTAIDVDGSFAIHVVTKPVKLKINASYLKESEHTKARLPGNLLRIRGKFSIRLADYGVKRGGLVLKVGEVADVRFDFFGNNK